MMPSESDNLMLCTCSTLGGIAEEAGKKTGKRVIRIDRPMAEKAVAKANKIAIAAALESTLEPTEKLLENAASDIGKTVDLVQMHIPAAWEKKKSGDEEGYIHTVAEHLEKYSEGVDVIVLAQGSMAPAKNIVSFKSPEILTSTEIGVRGALDLL